MSPAELKSAISVFGFMPSGEEIPQSSPFNVVTLYVLSGIDHAGSNRRERSAALRFEIGCEPSSR
jgi:hypothetical protein